MNIGEQIPYRTTTGVVVLQRVRESVWRVSVLRPASGAEVDELRRSWGREDTARIYARQLALGLNAATIDQIIEEGATTRALSRLVGTA